MITKKDIKNIIGEVVIFINNKVVSLEKKVIIDKRNYKMKSPESPQLKNIWKGKLLSLKSHTDNKTIDQIEQKHYGLQFQN